TERGPERGRFMYEVARLLYNAPEGRKPATEAFLLALRQQAGRAPRRPVVGGDRGNGPTESGPIPLTADIWGSAIFHRRGEPRDPVLTVVADHPAALLCLGLFTLDDATLAYLADRPLLLERIYERLTPAFVVAAPSLHIQNNRVVPPGGESAVPLWETVVNEKVTRPERF